MEQGPAALSVPRDASTFLGLFFLSVALADQHVPPHPRPTARPRRAEIAAMESQLRHTVEAIAQKRKNMAKIQEEIEMQVRGSELFFLKMVRRSHLQREMEEGVFKSCSAPFCPGLPSPITFCPAAGGGRPHAAALLLRPRACGDGRGAHRPAAGAEQPAGRGGHVRSPAPGAACRWGAAGRRLRRLLCALLHAASTCMTPAHMQQQLLFPTPAPAHPLLPTLGPCDLARLLRPVCADVVDLRREHQRALLARTLYGHVQNLLGYILSLYCIYR